MTLTIRLFWALPLVAGLSLISTARAECGGDINCIAVSIDGSAPVHGSPIESADLTFALQTIGTTSAARTISVAAVGGAVGSATLDAITLSGTDAADFSVSGGTCTTGTANLVHGGAACTVTVTFTPSAAGVRTAQVGVRALLAASSITRIVPLVGSGGDGGLPDPSDDPILRSLVRAQMESAKRFGGAQIANLQRRMESLHGARAGRVSGGEHTAAAVAPGSGHPGTPGAGSDASARPAAWLADLATTGSVSLWHQLDADGAAVRAGSTGVWAGGDVQFGSRGETGDSASLRFYTDGLTVGADHWFSERLALGLGLGFSHSRTEIGDDGTVDSADGSSLALYGSFLPTREIFVDALIGYGELDFDTRRYSAAAAATASSARTATQTFGSLAAGYTLRRNGVLLSPYARLDASLGELDRQTETGAGAYALTYFGHTFETAQLSLGLLAESAHPTDFGWALPRMRVELQHEDERDDRAEVAYVSDPATRYAVTAADNASDALLLGIGSDFVWRGGLTLALDYRASYSSESQDSQSIGLRVSQDLDARPPTLSPLAPEVFEDPVQIEASYTASDNVNRARESGNQLSDQIYAFNVRKTREVKLSDKTRALLGGSLGIERLRKHDGLDRVSGGLRGDYQYRTSSMYTATTFGVFAGAVLEDYESRLRAGARYTLGLSARKLFTDRIGVFGALEHNARDADSDVFDTSDNALRFTLDYTLGETSAVHVGAEYREGDTVSSAPSSPFYRDIADASAADDAYTGVAFDAVRYEAQTTVWSLGFNQAIGPRDSFELLWRHTDSEPLSIPSGGEYDGSGPRNYVTDTWSAFYLLRF